MKYFLLQNEMSKISCSIVMLFIFIIYSMQLFVKSICRAILWSTFMRNGSRTMQIFSIISASSSTRSKVEASHSWSVSLSQPRPINAISSRVKRCALPYGKGATVNLTTRGSRRLGEEGFERWVVTLVRALELSRFGPTFASGTPLCCAAPFSRTCACAYVRKHLCAKRNVERTDDVSTTPTNGCRK